LSLINIHTCNGVLVLVQLVQAAPMNS